MKVGDKVRLSRTLIKNVCNKTLLGHIVWRTHCIAVKDKIAIITGEIKNGYISVMWLDAPEIPYISMYLPIYLELVETALPNFVFHYGDCR